LLETAAAEDFNSGKIISSVEFTTFMLIFLIAVFISYIIYRSQNKR
jgi:preprotein translocase subunit YajC